MLLLSSHVNVIHVFSTENNPCFSMNTQDTPNPVLFPIQAPTELPRTVFPTINSPASGCPYTFSQLVGGQTDFAQDVPRDLRCSTKISATCVVEDVSIYLDILTLEFKSIPNWKLSPNNISIGFSQIAFPIIVLPKDDHTDSAQEERLGLPYWTMILAICVSW